MPEEKRLPKTQKFIAFFAQASGHQEWELVPFMQRKFCNVKNVFILYEISPFTISNKPQ
jgi:hypothetical protein